MKPIKIILFLVFVFCFTNGRAQDYIIKKSGEKVNCKIVKEDSAYLYYTLPKKDVQFQVDKSNIKGYYISAPGTKAADIPNANTSNEKPESVIIDLVGGFAFPTGDFGRKDYNSEKAGLARQGYLFQGSLVVKLVKNIGLCGSFQYQAHPIANDAFETQLAALSQGSNSQVTSGSWKIRGFYGGLYFAVPFEPSGGLSLFFKALIGSANYTSPELELRGGTGPPTAVVSQSAASARGISYMGSFGLLCKFNKSVGFNVSLGFLSGKADFSDVPVLINYTPYSTADFTQSFSSFNLQAGLSFIIN